MIFLKKIEFASAEENGGARLKTVFFAVGFSYLLALVLLFILALIVTYTPFNEDFSKTAVGVVNAICAFVCGVLSAKNAQSRGYLHGGICAVICRALLTVIGELIYTGADFGLHFVLSLVLAFIFGAIGGIVGINIGKR